ncbi:hypothetical protein K439DRAFT_1631516 [Ramaria rubella]|nr:hypothetical protein K439DRAFT_1631516 [Ramaria rubella]
MSVQGSIILAVQLLGLASLSALLVTVIVSQVHRHPVFVNFLCTYVLYGATTAFTHAVQSSLTPEDYSRGVVLMIIVLVDSVRMIALTSTLNLVIHLWFTMRSAFHNESARVEKLRTVMLLVSSYTMGLVPLIELSYRSQRHSDVVMNIVSYLELAIGIITLVWDILLLLIFCNNRRVFKRVHMCGIMTFSLLIRISVFCVFRLVFAAIFLVKLGVVVGKPHSRAIPILGIMVGVTESLYPLLTFCLLGTQRDILSVWFSCLNSDLRRDSAMLSNMALHTDIVAEEHVSPPDESYR